MNIEWYIALICAGLILVGAELIIPGGILGVFGGILVFAAVVMGFFIFPMPYSMLAAVGILVGSFVVFLIWMRVLPHTPIGKNLTLSKDGHEFKATADFHELIGQTGSAQTDLRPAGIATIGSQRLDVVSESDWIEKGSSVKVVRVEGNRIAVRLAETNA